MTETIRPQDDLYRAVNGAWLETTEIPADKSSWGSFMMLRDDAQEAVKNIITSLPEGAATGTNEQKIADLYASFMDTERLEELGAAPLEPLFARVAEVSDVDGLMKLLGWMFRVQFASPFGMGSDADPRQPQRYIAFISQSGLGLPNEEYYRLPEHAKVREAYVAHMGRMLALADQPDSEAMAARIMQLETEIAAMHWDKVRNRDMIATTNPMTLTDFEATYPGLHFAAFVEGLGIDRTMFEEMIVRQPSFFESLPTLLTEGRLDDWRAWAVWHITSSLAFHLNEAFNTERFGFVGTTLSGTPQQEERWRRGTQQVEMLLGEAIGEIYIQRHFPPEAKDRIDALVDAVLKAYKASIEKLAWMTDETRAEALDKLSKFKPKVGYPKNWRDYSKLEISRDDLVGNRLRAGEEETVYDLTRAMQPMDPDEWLMTPQTVNAYYHPLRNEIVFPAAILQKPFFSPDYSDAQNFGGIGAVIGHEIGHGFDDKGSTCDGDGVLRNWWTDTDRNAFEDRTAMLIEQFDALSPTEVPDQHVNGELTIGENIGDLGGVCIAYKAWRISQGKDDLEAVDDVAGAQEFFTQYATIWQTKRRPELAAQLLAVDPHSPGEFRANQIVRNVPQFYAAFDVQPTDKLWLDEDKRVQIW